MANKTRAKKTAAVADAERGARLVVAGVDRELREIRRMYPEAIPAAEDLRLYLAGKYPRLMPKALAARASRQLAA